MRYYEWIPLCRLALRQTDPLKLLLAIDSAMKALAERGKALPAYGINQEREAIFTTVLELTQVRGTIEATLNPGENNYFT